MSFGIGIGDIIAVSKLAYGIWGQIRDSPDQFRAIGTDFRGLCHALEDAGQGLPGLAIDQKQMNDLASLVQDCQEVLDDTNAALEDYASLGVKSSGLKARTQKTWKKFRWNERSIESLRGRIISSTAFLNAFIAGVTSKTAQSTNDKVTVLDGRVQDLQSHKDDQERRKLLKWVSALNFSSQQSTILEQRQEGTGQWLLESSDFQEWMTNGGGTLLCIGMPGAGKTMLACVAIDHLINTFRGTPDIGVAYIHCDYKQEKEHTHLNLLADLLKQLLQKSPSIPGYTRDLYEQRDNGPTSTRPTLTQILESLQLTMTSFARVFIVVDALDELQRDGNMLQNLLSNLFALQANKTVNLMLTSRDVPLVTEKVQRCVRLEVRASDEDVRKYLEGRMDELPKVVSRSPKIQQTIKDAIVSAVDGMFLLARLYLESLIDKLSLADIREALQSLPKGSEQALSLAYDQVMQRIEAQRPGIRQLARNALTWITYARRLLTEMELRHALGVEHGTSSFNEERLFDIEEIISACGGLIIVVQDQNEDTVRLVHYSTQDFLRESGDKYLRNAQQNIATSCLTCLLYDTFKEGWQNPSLESPDEWRPVRDRIQQYPLISYAAEYWGTFASSCLKKSVRDLAMQFLSDEYKVSSATQILIAPSLPAYQCRESWYAEQFLPWPKLSYIDESYPDLPPQDPIPVSDEDKFVIYSGLRSRNPTPVSGMHLASYYGNESLVLMLLENGFVADVRDDSNRSPLFWASLRGQDTVVDLLLSIDNIKADLVIEWDHRLSTSAMIGSQRRGIQCSEPHKKVNINASDAADHEGPISRRTENESQAKLGESLTLSIVDVNCQDKYGYTPLRIAAERNHDQVVARLLKSVNILVNLADLRGETPLIYAIEKGFVRTVRHLVAHADIDVNLRTPDGDAPLLRAAMYGSVAVVHFLLSLADIDVNIVGGEEYYGMTPLSAAVRNYRYGVAKLLLAHHDIDVNHKNKWGETAFTMAASPFGGEATLKLFLNTAGVEVNSIDMYGQTPLFRSAYGWYKWKRRSGYSGVDSDYARHEKIVRLLLTRADIDIDCFDENGNNLLSNVTKYAEETPEPRLEGVIALLCAATEDRSRARCVD